MGYSEYKDLTPIDNINNGDEYLNALEWALNNPKVKNIALAARMEQVKAVLSKHI